MPALWKKIYPIARSPCQENTHAKQASFFVVVCLFVWGFVVFIIFIVKPKTSVSKICKLFSTVFPLIVLLNILCVLKHTCNKHFNICTEYLNWGFLCPVCRLKSGYTSHHSEWLYFHQAKESWALGNRQIGESLRTRQTKLRFVKIKQYRKETEVNTLSTFTWTHSTLTEPQQTSTKSSLPTNEITHGMQRRRRWINLQPEPGPKAKALSSNTLWAGS